MAARRWLELAPASLLLCCFALAAGQSTSNVTYSVIDGEMSSPSEAQALRGLCAAQLLLPHSPTHSVVSHQAPRVCSGPAWARLPPEATSCRSVTGRPRFTGWRENFAAGQLSSSATQQQPACTLHEGLARTGYQGLAPQPGTAWSPGCTVAAPHMQRPPALGSQEPGAAALQ